MSDNFTARELAFAELVRSRLETFHGFFFNGDDEEAEHIAEAVRWASQTPDGAMKVRVHVVVDITDDGKQLVQAFAEDDFFDVAKCERECSVGYHGRTHYSVIEAHVLPVAKPVVNGSVVA